MKKSPSAHLSSSRDNREKARANAKMFEIPAFNPNKIRKSIIETDSSPSTSAQPEEKLEKSQPEKQEESQTQLNPEE
jgi:hypothetical protein